MLRCWRWRGLGWGKEGKKSAWTTGDPQLCHEVNAFCQARALGFPNFPPVSTVLLFVFLVPRCPKMMFPFCVTGLNFFPCWLSMAPTEFTIGGWNPLAPKAAIVMGGALWLDCASSLSEFVPQQTSPKNFLEMKYTLDTGASADNLLGSSYGRFGCAVSSLCPRNQKTVCDLDVSLFHFNGPSSVTIAQNEWPDHRSCIIRRQWAYLRLNFRFHRCKLFSMDGDTAR